MKHEIDLTTAATVLCERANYKLYAAKECVFGNQKTILIHFH